MVNRIFKFLKNDSKLKKKINVISVGDIIQFKGGKGYKVKRVNKPNDKYSLGNIYLEPHGTWFPVPLPGDNSLEKETWDNIRYFNYDMEQRAKSIQSVVQTEESREPDFYRLSKEEAHDLALQCMQNKKD
ncbi:hypothetical protein D8M04_19815 [Oceanobacillus piezotolerans]|uniref:Uncharacterized protein n=1 Tax=Oceanobacillus piezotolerans TaxID=2448030 RepID=A0A498D5M3_9BACI|nr:hypothetical protein [Oceanobacillus piezotolerans]RLL39804.1 hypothetical protein D8M04_19815 [Oceanobacillus piezotolerans]